MHSTDNRRKESKRVWLYSRPGNDLTHRFPLIVERWADKSAGIQASAGAKIADHMNASINLVLRSALARVSKDGHKPRSRQRPCFETRRSARELNAWARWMALRRSSAWGTWV
jgi:hypothetical protein